MVKTTNSNDDKLTQEQKNDALDGDMFNEGEGRRDDGSIGVPKITMASIRALPGRCQELNGGMGGRLKIAIFSGVANGINRATAPETGEVFFGLKGDFSAVRFDTQGEPDAVFKSDTLYFPIGHQAALDAFEKTGHLSFSLEFYSQPARNPSGYSWSYTNLAKLDRNNLSAIDRLTIMAVQTSRSRADKPAAGLLEDLRRDPEAAE